MNLIQFAEAVAVSFKKSSGGTTITFEAGRDYLITDAQLDRIMKDENIRARCYKQSKTQTRFTNFHVGIPKNGNVKLLFYDGAGGYGDQVMAWPVAKILQNMGYEVHVACDPGNNVAWWNFPWIKSVNIMPMLYEHAKMFDFFVNFEVVTNNDEHQDQLHPLDAMLRVIGIAPDSIDSSFKVVRPNFTYSEANLCIAQLNGKGPLAMYQISTTNPARSLPPNDSAFMAVKLADEFPDMTWLCLYDEFVPTAYVDALKCAACAGTGTASTIDKDGNKVEDAKQPCPTCNGHKWRSSNILPYCAPGLRELWGLTQHVKVVVSPDSLMVHAAGMLEVPCVGLWGATHPANRVRYYKNHLPIYHREFCPFSPCFVYTATFPKYCPPRPGGRTVCECMAGIAPAEVIDAVRKIRRP